MNKTQNGCRLLNVFLIRMKLTHNVSKVLNDGDKLLGILEKMCLMIFYK
jgi:hypothetical protein